MLPRVPFASVLVEVDARTGFTGSPGPRRREGEPAGGAQAQPDVRDHRGGHEHGADRDGRVLRCALRRARLDCRVVLPAGDPGGGERGDRQLPPPAAADPGVRARAPCRPRTGSGSRSRANPSPPGRCRGTSPAGRGVHLHPRLRPALHLRHEGDRGDRPGRPLRAGRAAGQRDRSAGVRARHGHPRRDPGELRPVRPGRQAAVAPDPRPREDHPVPDRPARPTSWPATRTPGRC